MFNKKGYIVVEKTKADEEKLMNAVLEAGADDFQDDGRELGVVQRAGGVHGRERRRERLGIEPTSAKVPLIPQNSRQARRQARAADGEADGSARRSRRRAEHLVELRHLGEGDRGLAGVITSASIRDSCERAMGACRPTDRVTALITCGASQHSASATFPEKLLVIHSRLTTLLSECRPDAVAIEDLFHAVNARSALKLGHARGVAMLAAVEAGVQVFEYAPPKSNAWSSDTGVPRSRKCSR